MPQRSTQGFAYHRPDRVDLVASVSKPEEMYKLLSARGTSFVLIGFARHYHLYVLRSSQSLSRYVVTVTNTD
jgi:hypothetical protein